jgi:glucan biosynthesis protein C
MSEKTRPARLLYIDNIRWLIIIFVVLTHAAVTYSDLGSWYYTELANLDVLSFAVFGIYLSFTQAYSMGLLFLIAGYFVPGSFDHKGFDRFLGDRSIRLGVPTLIYIFLINTIIVYYILSFQWEEPRPPAGQAFLDYILSLNFLGGSGPMWFALALLIFSAVYAAFRLFLPAPKRRQVDEKLPGHLAVAGLVLLITVCTFSVRLVQPIGTSVMNMQLCFFSQYIILFIVGIIAYRKNWFARIPYSFGMAWFKMAIIGGSIFWLAIMVLGGGISGDLSNYSGGFYWQSAAYSFWESFFCIGFSLGLIVLFREHYNWQGKFERFMSENYFAVYFFHAPILILVTLAMRDLPWSPLLKFIVAGSISVILCFLTSHLVLRRIPLLKRVL